MGGVMAAAKTYRIFFWHGRTESLAEEIYAIDGVTANGEGDLHYTGSLDEFVVQYGRHFIVKPQHDKDPEYDDLICVTQYGSWSAR